MIDCSPDPKARKYVLSKLATVCGHEIPAGFSWDGQSLPWWVPHVLVGSPFETESMEASCLHDWLYHSHDTTRKAADQLFYDLCVYNGVPRWRAELKYWALRLFGGKAWRRS